jgi:hypothetical protein
MRAIDRAVRYSPPPLDDVGGGDIEDFDILDPYRRVLEEIAAKAPAEPVQAS